MTHKNLEVWKRGVEYVTKIYSLTKNFPKEELFCITNQIRRAAISVPSNIAEGAARHSQKELIQFLYIALGSLQELDTQLLISKKLNYISDNDYLDIIQDNEIIGKMLVALIKAIKNKSNDK